MRLVRPILALGATVALLVGCTSGTPAASTGGADASSGGGTAATSTPVTGQATTSISGPSAAPGAASGSAHYELSGPSSASGDIPFHLSWYLPKGGTAGPGGAARVEKVVFESKTGDPYAIILTFPTSAGAKDCNGENIRSCGLVQLQIPTVAVQAPGWQGMPFPGHRTCTWDTGNLTANGGTGSVECTEAGSLLDPSGPQYQVKITFTYADPKPAG